MSIVLGIVDGWEVRSRDDGGFGVYDGHGMISGPHGSKAEALGAAMKLPKPQPLTAFLRDQARQGPAPQPVEQD